jgi:hypothetical protein
MPTATMPKATVGEECNLKFWENEIWITCNGNMPPPTRNPLLSKNGGQSQLG